MCHSEDVAMRVHHCLIVFSTISRLSINLSKHSVICIGSDLEYTIHIANDLQFRIGTLPMPYLGLPIRGKMLDCSSWSHVEELFRSRLILWKSEHLSLGEKFTLIKSVLNSILIYALSVCLLLMGVRNKLYSIMSNFLWEGTDNSRRMHLVDWNTISLPLDKGGLGITRLEDLNTVLIVK